MALRPDCATSPDRLTMHDPAVLRLAFAGLYAAGAILAAVAARSSGGRARAFWALTAAILLLLMAAKDLHLIETLSRTGRATIKSVGWYAEHREVQAGLLILSGAIALAAAAFVARWLRRTGASVKVAAAALLFLIAFLVLRAISVHAVDRWTTSAFAGMRKGWWVELVATLVICVAAALNAAAPRRRGV